MLDNRLQSLASELQRMTPQQRQQFASMHKDDPIMLGMAKFVNDQQQALSTAMQGAQAGAQLQQPPVVDQTIAQMATPEMMGARGMPPRGAPAAPGRGLSALPARNMESMPDGGVAGYAAGGSVGYAKGGPVNIDAMLDAEGVRDPRRRAFIKALYAQESSSGDNTATSNRGAVGGMQILPSTFDSVADPGWNIKNPEHNARAGIRYGLQGYDAAGGDPVLAGAYYYGGPAGMQRTAAGADVKDPKNPGAPGTQGYGSSITKRMLQFLPMGSAQAETMPGPQLAPDATYDQRVAAIPGQDGKPVGPQPVAQDPGYSVLDNVVGAGKAALAIPYNAGALLTSGLGALTKKTLGDSRDANDIASENFDNISWRPSGAGGDMLDSVGRSLDWLPPYLGGIVGPRGPNVGKAGAVAKAANEKIGLPRLKNNPTPDIPENAVPTPGNVRAIAGQAAQEKAGLTALAGDQDSAFTAGSSAAQATADASRLAGNARYARGVANRAGIAGLTGSAASNSTSSPTALVDGSYSENSVNPVSGGDVHNPERGGAPTQDPQDVIDAAKKAAPQMKGKGLSGEDWLTLGLGMMATKSPYFLQAVGEGGLGMLKNRQENEKLTSEAALREAQGKMQTSEAGYWDQQKGPAAAMAQVTAQMGQWEKENAIRAQTMDPQMFAAERQRVYQQTLRNTFGAMGLPLPGSITSGFKVVGVR